MTSRPRRPDRAVYVPRARRSQTTPPASTPCAQNPEPAPSDSVPADTCNLPSQTRTRSSAPSSPAAKQPAIAGHPLHTTEPTTNGVPRTTNDTLSSASFEATLINGTCCIPPSAVDQRSTDETMENRPKVGLRIEDARFDKTIHNAKEDKDEKELQRASKVCIP